MINFPFSFHLFYCSNNYHFLPFNKQYSFRRCISQQRIGFYFIFVFYALPFLSLLCYFHFSFYAVLFLFLSFSPFQHFDAICLLSLWFFALYIYNFDDNICNQTRSKFFLMFFNFLLLQFAWLLSSCLYSFLVSFCFRNGCGFIALFIMLLIDFISVQVLCVLWVSLIHYFLQCRVFLQMFAKKEFVS